MPSRRMLSVLESRETQPLSPENRTRLTFRWDLLRGGMQGVLDPIWHTFVLLVAIRVFHATDNVKSIIVAAVFLGLLLNPLTLSFFSKRKERVGVLCGTFALGSGICLLGMAHASHWMWYAVFGVLGPILMTQIIPFTTHIYATNYSGSERGNRVATTTLVLGILGALTAFAGGRLLNHDINRYTLFFSLAATANLVMAFAFWKMPTEPARMIRTGSPWQNLSLAWKDRLFGFTLFAWFLLGIGNLMTFPLRIEYMANPKYGINASEFEIALIMGVVPLVMRLVSTKLWGILFDRFSIIPIRVLINICFLASILLFFITDRLWVMGLSMGMIGLAFGGGRIMWQLWVTRIAPTDRVSSYMSVHTALTGLRGVLAPFLGYYLMARTSPEFTGFFAQGFVIVSTVLFLLLKGAVKTREQSLSREAASVRPALEAGRDPV